MSGAKSKQNNPHTEIPRPRGARPGKGAVSEEVPVPDDPDRSPSEQAPAVECLAPARLTQGAAPAIMRTAPGTGAGCAARETQCADSTTAPEQGTGAPQTRPKPPRDSVSPSPSASPPPSPLSFSSSVSPYSPSATHPADNGTPPLSMSFLHMPSRAQVELQKTSDSTAKNSHANAHSAWQPDSPSCSSRDSTTSLSAHPGTKLVRKKSGEIVKSLVKDKSSSHRALSLPSTPTFKQVHFRGDNDVRYFKEKDKPTAISAQNSPAVSCDEDDDEGTLSIASHEYDSDDSDEFRPQLNASSGADKTYFDYYDDELNPHVDKPKPRPRSSHPVRSQSDWVLKMLNFSASSRENIVSHHKSVFLEDLFLSPDKKYLVGQVAVMNVAFEKEVTSRYTLDNWDTVMEIHAVYIPDAPSILKTFNYDRFVFNLSLNQLMSLCPSARNTIAAQFCIRYNVPGQEMWDSNNGQNYHFQLSKSVRSLPKSEVPTTAMTKHDPHTRRPKYSSSYLKKMNSEPSLSKPEHFPIPKKKEGVSNDFEVNDFYMSSPLLSNYKNISAMDEFLKDAHSELPFASRVSGRPSTSGVTYRKSSPEKLPLASKEATTQHASQAPRMSKKLHESMSYKELLDSYCFFNSNTGEGDAAKDSESATAPSSMHSENPLEPAFTVSSFLM